MLNEVTLIGTLGKDPEVINTKTGKMIAKVSLATEKRWKDQATGETKKQSQWHNIVVYSQGFAKVLAQYTKKGSKIYIKGELQTRMWEDKDGKKNYTTEVVLSDMSHQLLLLDKPTGQTANQPKQQSYKQPQHNGLEDDAIPF